MTSNQSICQCCLTLRAPLQLSAPYMHRGVREVYYNMLLECFGLEYLLSLQVPATGNICPSCVTHLRSALKFRHQIARAQETLAQQRAVRQFSPVKSKVEMPEPIEEMKIEVGGKRDTELEKKKHSHCNIELEQTEERRCDIELEQRNHSQHRKDSNCGIETEQRKHRWDTELERREDSPCDIELKRKEDSHCDTEVEEREDSHCDSELEKGENDLEPPLNAKEQGPVHDCLSDDSMSVVSRDETPVNYKDIRTGVYGSAVVIPTAELGAKEDLEPPLNTKEREPVHDCLSDDNMSVVSRDETPVSYKDIRTGVYGSAVVIPTAEVAPEEEEKQKLEDFPVGKPFFYTNYKTTREKLIQKLKSFPLSKPIFITTNRANRNIVIMPNDKPILNPIKNRVTNLGASTKLNSNEIPNLTPDETNKFNLMKNREIIIETNTKLKPKEPPKLIPSRKQILNPITKRLTIRQSSIKLKRKKNPNLTHKGNQKSNIINNKVSFLETSTQLKTKENTNVIPNKKQILNPMKNRVIVLEASKSLKSKEIQNLTSVGIEQLNFMKNKAAIRETITEIKRKEPIQLMPIENQRLNPIKNGVTVTEASTELKPAETPNPTPDEIEKLKLIQNTVTILTCSNATPFLRKAKKFCCFYCGEPFRKLEMLVEHTRMVHVNIERTKICLSKYTLPGYIVFLDVTELTCKLCLEKIKSVDDLRVHLQTEHNRKLDPSSDRNVPFKLIADVKCNNGFECQKCGEIFRCFVGLLHHMNKHYQNYICHKCGAGYMTQKRVQEHEKLHNLGEFSCHCGKTFTTQAKLTHHDDVAHKNVLKENCPSKRFSQYCKRARHIALDHAKLERKFVIKCGTCQKNFKSRTSLVAHTRKIHLNQLNFMCEKCSFRCNSNANLQRHMGRHEGVKKYECDLCNKMYTRKCILREHLRIHYNDRRFVCDVCGKAFVQKASMIGHMKTHKSDVNYY